jgi:glucose-1-phosphate cytidylyltransferase
MKVVILAGGFGTRLSELTGEIPKPMVPIGQRPILWHIMNHYAKYGYNEFVLALGYKAEIIKDFFLNYPTLNSDFTIFMKTGDVDWHNRVNEDWKVTLVDTGLKSMTGGRLRRLKSILADEPFLLTYGDGLSDVDIKALVDFHNSSNKMVTVTTVHPGARFGELDIEKNEVRSFKEKPQTAQGWINGGFFVIEPEFLNLISSDDTVLEKEPLESVALDGQLSAFKHEGFWQCMDTVRDRNYLEDLWVKGEAPWA